MPYFRKMLRGYNQAELLAKNVSVAAGTPFDTSVLKRKSSPSRQVVTRTRAERLRNQKGTFRVTSNVEGKDIILIDDVTTTGSTLLEARRVLLDAGARSVIAITIAH
jgi:ComF family protein